MLVLGESAGGLYRLMHGRNVGRGHLSVVLGLVLSRLLLVGLHALVLPGAHARLVDVYRKREDSVLGLGLVLQSIDDLGLCLLARPATRTTRDERGGATRTKRERRKRQRERKRRSARRTNQGYVSLLDLFRPLTWVEIGRGNRSVGRVWDYQRVGLV